MALIWILCIFWTSTLGSGNCTNNNDSPDYRGDYSPSNCNGSNERPLTPWTENKTQPRIASTISDLSYQTSNSFFVSTIPTIAHSINASSTYNDHFPCTSSFLSDIILCLERLSEVYARKFYKSNVTSAHIITINENVTLEYHYLNFQNHTETGLQMVFVDSERDQDQSVILSESTLQALNASEGLIMVVHGKMSQSHFLQPKILKTEKQKTSDFTENMIVSDTIIISVFVLKNTSAEDISPLQKHSVAVEYTVTVQSNFVKDLWDQGRKIITDELDYACVFYDTNLSDWSTFGCEVLSSSGNNLQKTCSCNHTTAFSIMLTVRSIKIPASLQLTTRILEAVSILALAITSATVVGFRKVLPVERFVTEIGISASLMFMHIFFLMGDIAVAVQMDINSTTFCEISAVAAQYFTICTVAWMLSESVILFMKTRKSVMKFNGKSLTTKLLISGWIIPFLYVAVCAIAGFMTDSYMRNVAGEIHSSISCIGPEQKYYDQCWISKDMSPSIIVPVGLILTINTGILISVVWVVRNLSLTAKNLQPRHMTKRKTSLFSKQSENVAALRGALLLLPVMGITWVLGFLVNIPRAEVVLASIHGVINGLQGLFVLIIFCIKNKEMRKAAIRLKENMSRDLT
ncbi:adhesion G-protein coupled receptor G2-like [Clavelina lepadiformis]|uniref:adhesion G-protein coupled receptor G2-like n=1 Tax=Clavelina lepadiformis TaxID=159417 RepID=UPI0040431E4E